MVSSAKKEINDEKSAYQKPSLKRLLIVANPGLDQQSLFSQAASLKQQYGCKAYLLAFSTIESDGSKPLGEANTIEQELKLLSLGFFTEGDQLQVSVIEVEKKSQAIAEQVIKFSKENDIDLVVKTSHPSGNVFHQSTDWELIRNLNCNLLLLSEKKWKNKQTILAAIDVENQNALQQNLNHKVLGWTKIIAQSRDDEVHVLSCIELNRALVELDMVETFSVERKKELPLKTQIKALADDEGLLNIKPWISAGEPSRKIPSIASAINAELVVIGSVGRKGLQGMMLGNTAEKVLKTIRTDTLIIRPDY